MFVPRRIEPLLSPPEQAGRPLPALPAPHVTVAGVGVRFDASPFVVLVCAAVATSLRTAAQLLAVLSVAVVLVELVRVPLLRALGFSGSIQLTVLGGVFVAVRGRARVLPGVIAPLLHLALGLALLKMGHGQGLFDALARTHLGLGLLQALPVAPFDGGAILDDLLPPSRPLLRLIVALAVLTEPASTLP